MFEKTLTDVVKGIRASKRDTALYISQVIAEIKEEIHSSDMFVKANALQKLTFLQMMGYSMNVASFATIEVMSSPRFAHKRIGYLAATQGFTQDTEVILLATNLLKKELSSAVGSSLGGNMGRVYEAGLAVNCLSNIVTEDLARDLLPEVTNLLSHPQPYLRKKAVLCLFKMFVKYPQGLRLTFAKLQCCLDDNNTAVVSCAVNVITELSDKNPRNYLHLAPAFFTLLTQSSNNWMLIKVIKLLGSLVPEEPRLARKLLEPLAGIARKTQAKSLLFEAVHTITLCLPYCRKNDGSMPAVVPDIVELCAKTCRELVEDSDQNLKYLGLVGFGSLMVSHPRVLSTSDYRPLILQCLSDPDVTIRTRSLDLLQGMVTRKNLVELVTQLMKHVESAKGQYRQDLVAKIMGMCAGEKYALLSDFSWYFSILLKLGHMPGLYVHADRIRAQVTDVALRVLPVRAYCVRRSIDVLLRSTTRNDGGKKTCIMPDILPALAWIVGEYSDLVESAVKSQDGGVDEEFFYMDDSKGSYHAIIQALTSPWNSMKLPTSTQEVFVQNAMKLLAAASRSSDVDDEELEACAQTIQQNLVIYVQSLHPEVVERSFSALRLLESLGLTASEGSSRFNGISNGTHRPSSDLLGLSNSSAPVPIELTPSNDRSLAAKLRDQAELLNALWKPSPMKPTSAKAQRKKLLDPTSVSVDINTLTEPSLLVDLLAEELDFRSSAKLSLDSVNFTDQKLSYSAVESPQAPRAIDLVSSDMLPPPAGDAASSSFQHGPSAQPASAAASRPMSSDPFYLNSAILSDDEVDEKKQQSAFGAIQLLDSDEEGAGDTRRRKKKKNKKSKTRTTEVDDIWSSMKNTGHSMPTSGPVFYDSDEDDGAAASGDKGRTKEFSGLAQVDLTTPLRNDEVMPERKHHVVANRPVLLPEPSRKDKRAKKQKKKSKKDRIEDADLLGFGPVTSITPTIATPGAPSSSNPIDTAFDDLLSLGLPPAPLSSLSVPMQSHSAPSKKSKRSLWIKMSIKSQSGSIDGSHVSASFQAVRSSGGVKLTLRIENQSSTPLSSMNINLKGYGSYALGSVGAQSIFKSDELGPLSAAASTYLKGRLSCTGGLATLRFTLPCSLDFVPEAGVTVESLGAELGRGQWASSSAKVSMSHTASLDKAKALVAKYLNASEIVGITDPSSTGFAARHRTGNSAVRVLVKHTDASVLKVDIKSTNQQIATTLASDMKNLIL